MRRTKTESADTRAALLDAAERIFHEKGVAQTSLAEIASAAGLTRGAIYWHFADKAALFEAMQERGRLPQEIAAALVEANDAPDPLAQLCEVSLEALRHLAGDERSQRVCAIMLLRCEFVGEMAEVLNRMRNADRDLEGALRQGFRDAEARGRLSSRWTPETATLAHFSAMGGLISHWLRVDKAFDLLSVGEPMIRCLFADFSVRRA